MVDAGEQREQLRLEPFRSGENASSPVPKVRCLNTVRSVARSARERRRWTSTVAEGIPEGPEGQPAHEVGSEVTVADLVEVPGVGAVSVTVARPSALLLGPATFHARKAARLGAVAAKQVGRSRWAPAGHEMNFTNEALVFDFYEHAMAAVVLTHTALDNVLNELLPADFTFSPADGETWTREYIESSVGIERRATQIAAAASGRPNIRTARPDLFERVVALKALRDDLGHAKRDRGYGGPQLNRTIFSDLFAANFAEMAETPTAVGDHYGWA